MLRNPQFPWPALALAGMLAALCAVPAPAQGPDPVDELKRAVEKESKAEVLQEIMGRLKSLPQLLDASQLRLLVTTRHEEYLDLLNKQIREPLKAKIQKVVRGADRESKLALAVRIGEVKVERAAFNLLEGLKDYVQFTHFLSEQMQEMMTSPASTPAIRQAAARGLGNLLVVPPRALDSLKSMFAAGRTVGEKRAAAAALPALVNNYDQLLRALPGFARSDIISQKDVLELSQAVIAGAKVALRQDDAVVRGSALEGLVRIAEFLNSESTLQVSLLQLPLPSDEAAWKEAVERILATHKLVEPTLASMSSAVQEPEFLQTLTSPNNNLRLLGLEVLEKLGNVRLRIEQRLQAIEQPPLSGAADVLKPGLDKAVQQAAKNLRNPDTAVRLATAEFLERVGRAAEATIPDLKSAMKDRSPFVRWVVMRVLGKVGSLELATVQKDIPPATQQLLGKVVLALGSGLGESDVDIRTTAAETIASLAEQASGLKEPTARRHTLAIVQQSIPALTKFVGGPLVDEQSRLSMLKAITMVGVPKADAAALTPVLAGILARSKEADIRREAAVALGSMGPLAASATGALKLALRDNDEGVRKAASNALLRIQLPNE